MVKYNIIENISNDNLKEYSFERKKEFKAKIIYNLAKLNSIAKTKEAKENPFEKCFNPEI